MSSPDPSTHKRIGRGVRNSDSAVWDREKQNAVLFGNYHKFTQNSAMKPQPLSAGNKRLADASPLDPVWGNCLRADDPRDKDPRQWRGLNLLGEALSAVREAIRDSDTGSTHPSSAGRFRTSTGNAGIHEISSAPQLCSFGIFDLFPGRAGRPKPGSSGDSFWRRPWPCALRTRPLPRGYCDARRRFVYYRNCNT